MKAVFKSSYPAKSEKLGNYEMWVFTIQGTQAELDQYVVDNPKAPIDETTGKPLFLTAYPVIGCDKHPVELYRSRAGKYGLDNGELRRAQSIAGSMGATEQFNNIAMNTLAGNLFGRRTTISVVTAASVIADEAVADEEVTEVADEADLDNI
jgi:hypothetical protein